MSIKKFFQFEINTEDYTDFKRSFSICSVLYYFEGRKMLLIYSLSVLLLYLGLPFFQSSSNILIGHYVNISIFIVLSFAASRISFFSFLANFKSNKLLENVNLELKELTLVDDLTKIPNRRNFNAYIDFKYRYTTRVDSLVSVIMIDIDCFKQYNDNYSHMAGDEIIIIVAQQIHSIVRNSQDFVARIGGDEFVFISENTSEEGIFKIANRIIKSIDSLKIPHMHSDVSQYVTLSLGTATTKPKCKEDIYKCLEAADKALYFTKTKGRNGVTSYNQTLTNS